MSDKVVSTKSNSSYPPVGKAGVGISIIINIFAMIGIALFVLFATFSVGAYYVTKWTEFVDSAAYNPALDFEDNFESFKSWIQIFGSTSTSFEFDAESAKTMMIYIGGFILIFIWYVIATIFACIYSITKARKLRVWAGLFNLVSNFIGGILILAGKPVQVAQKQQVAKQQNLTPAQQIVHEQEKILKLQQARAQIINSPNPDFGKIQQIDAMLNASYQNIAKINNSQNH